MKSRILPLLVALASIALIAACDDPNSPDATLPVYTVDSQAVWTLNQSPANAPNALNFGPGTSGAALVHAFANYSLNFDLAFDLDDQGRVVVMPLRRVVSELVGGHRVGLQLIENTHYDSLKIAPQEGYAYDSTFVVSPGALFAVRIEECFSIYLDDQAIYAKLLVLGVDQAQRKVALKYTGDPNCGFRSLTSGVPRD